MIFMKVKELIDKLKMLDPKKDVCVPCDDGEYGYYIAHSVINKTLTILESDVEVVVIDFE